MRGNGGSDQSWQDAYRIHTGCSPCRYFRYDGCVTSGGAKCAVLLASREIIIKKKPSWTYHCYSVSFICWEQTGTDHTIPPPYRTVPHRTNTYQYRTYIHTNLDSFDLLFSFFSSSLLFLSPPSCLSFFCNLSLCRSLSQTLPSSLSYPLLSLHSPLPNPLSLTWRLCLSSRPSGRIVRPFWMDLFHRVERLLMCQ